MMITLKYCKLYAEPTGVETIFYDGTISSNWPPPYTTNNKPFIDASKDCGFANNWLDYIRDHDLSHAFIAEKFFDKPSPIVWASAHQIELDETARLFEERWVYHWQKFVHNSGPPLEDDWISGKDEYLALWHRLQK
jgi:hypothetical protein